MTSERSPGFLHGVFAGFTGFVVLVHLWLAAELADLAGMYREFGDVQLPLATRITLHPVWLWGAPLVGLVAVTTLLVKRPRALAVYVVVAIAVAAAAIATYYFPRAPLFALAGNIAVD